MKLRYKLLIAVLVLILLAIGVGGFVVYWKISHSGSVGVRHYSEEQLKVDVNQYASSTEAIYQLRLPKIQYQDGFSFYNQDVQHALHQKIKYLQQQQSYAFSDPLMILNPYGTVTNGLYVYFQADVEGELSYTIETQLRGQTQHFSREVRNVAKAQGAYKFQMIGLVPGVANKVTMTLKVDGDVRQTSSFQIEMPRTASTYPHHIQKEQGSSKQTLSKGLFYMMGTSGFSGYTFFFDNQGIMRAELRTESYKVDRIVPYQHDLIFPASHHKIVRMNSLGRIEQIYLIKDYEQHHDFVLGSQGQLLVLASKTGFFTIRREDILISVDLSSGKVTELVDFAELLGDYKARTSPTKEKFGFIPRDLDWIHLNAIQQIDQGEVIVSSRETSTIIKVEDILRDPSLAYLIGPQEVWDDTIYADKLLEKQGDFPIQAGQHAITYTTSPELDEGQYYIEMFNNNYWRFTSRPDFQASLDKQISYRFRPNPYDHSYYYKYLVDEQAGTFELVKSWPVPYSSIVSDIQPYHGHTVVNSGMADVFGEYDADGDLIARFYYTNNQFTYRVFKATFRGFWFEE